MCVRVCAQVDLDQGLTQVETERRRKLCGANEFDLSTPEPLWKKYLEQVRIRTSSLAFYLGYYQLSLVLISYQTNQ